MWDDDERDEDDHYSLVYRRTEKVDRLQMHSFIAKFVSVTV